MKRFLIAAAALFVAVSSYGGPKWVSLFNGKDLTGWHQATGVGEYTVAHKAIVGTTHQAGGGNSFLVTDQKYSDFILEFEYKISTGAGNTGVQFRSYLNDKGIVNGYQFEIDNSTVRNFTGGVYQEGSNWLYKLTFNQKARSASRMDKWNKARIEAVGTHIRTFVNGVECADLYADLESEGFFGLQVHAVRDTTTFGKTVQWRKIRICTEDIDQYLTPENPEVHQVNWLPNTLSERQKAEGWKLLFDGKTTKGWRSLANYDFPKDGWTVSNGILQANTPNQEKTVGGDICTVDSYKNFWLSVDFKIGKGANSGIKYFVRPGYYGQSKSGIGCEYQILDDTTHPDAKLGANGNRTLASLYDMIPSSKEDMWFNLGQWNTAWIIVNGNHVEHYLNGALMVEYDRDSPIFEAIFNSSKFGKLGTNFAHFEDGHILLQDHGDFVQYRNILIKELPAPEEQPQTSILDGIDMTKGWKDLWDGKTSAGWTSVKGGGFPEKGWAMEDGVLIANPVKRQRGGDIITEKTYQDFALSLDFKLTEGANGGIKYFVNPGTFQDPSIGCEYQVLDDEKHRDAKLGIGGNRTAASLYDLIKADKSNADFKLYDWNTALLVVKGNKVEHWLNGVKVLEYERNTPAFNTLVQRSKYKDFEGFGNFKSGHILLQDHMDTVYYRNIKIKEL